MVVHCTGSHNHVLDAIQTYSRLCYFSQLLWCFQANSGTALQRIFDSTKMTTFTFPAPTNTALRDSGSKNIKTMQNGNLSVWDAIFGFETIEFRR